MSKLFTSIESKKPTHNRFNLSYENKFSCKMGNLYPVFVQDVIPGDRFRVNTGSLVRLAPMLAPVMHRASIFMHYFFVPNRLIHDNWESFITGGEDGKSTATLPLVPLSSLNFSANLPLTRKGTLWDFLGYPVTSSSTASITVSTTVDVSYLRAYQLIYNEYYRDQNLTKPVTILKGDVVTSNELLDLLPLRKRAWEKDYFTSALPWAQRGAQVNIPISGTAPVNYVGGNSFTNPARWHGTNPANIISDSPMNLKKTTLPSGENVYVSYDDRNNSLAFDPAGTLAADLSTASATSINDLRRAFRLQAWLEKSARGGSRYIEQIYSHFGVKSSDARLQRPEYLGGGRSNIMFSEVLQTSSTSQESTPQANMAGHGVAAGNTHQFSRFFEEHGIVIGIMSIIPRTAYQQGVSKRLTRKDRFDFFWPEFAHLGEQPILNKEIFTDFNSGSGSDFNERVFGYTPRYAEYRFNLSQVHGDFRDNLNFWHMGRIFSTAPNLNTSFVSSDPTTRIFAVTDQSVDNVYVELYNQVQAIRPLPRFGTPTI